MFTNYFAVGPTINPWNMVCITWGIGSISWKKFYWRFYWDGFRTKEKGCKVRLVTALGKLKICLLQPPRNIEHQMEGRSVGCVNGFSNRNCTLLSPYRYESMQDSMPVAYLEGNEDGQWTYFMIVGLWNNCLTWTYITYFKAVLVRLSHM